MEGVVFFMFLVVLYFLPTFIAGARSKRNVGAICVLNIFLGWTFIGWLIALIWALTYEAPVVEVAR